MSLSDDLTRTLWDRGTRGHNETQFSQFSHLLVALGGKCEVGSGQRELGFLVFEVALVRLGPEY